MADKKPVASGFEGFEVYGTPWLRSVKEVPGSKSGAFKFVFEVSVTEEEGVDRMKSVAGAANVLLEHLPAVAESIPEDVRGAFVAAYREVLVEREKLRRSLAEAAEEGRNLAALRKQLERYEKEATEAKSKIEGDRKSLKEAKEAAEAKHDEYRERLAAMGVEIEIEAERMARDMARNEIERREKAEERYEAIRDALRLIGEVATEGVL